MEHDFEAATQRGRRVIDLCRELGFARAGVAPAEPTRWAAELDAWLAAGKHGSMAYMADHAQARRDVRTLLEGARSVIMVADLYAPRGSTEEPAPPSRGRIARYARGRDYHKVMKRRLHALCDALRLEFQPAEFRAFVDTAPVLEREHAARAGLGWIGKNTLLIDPRIGSYTLLGGAATTLELLPPPAQSPVADHCGTCTRCIDACPTGAITPYSVNASRCISYLTIERRGPIDPAFFTPIGQWIYGCDICQEVCPHNSPRPAAAAQSSAPVNPDYTPQRSTFDLLSVLNWSEEDRRREFTGSAMKRATLDMMKRNALIAAGNALRSASDPPLQTRIEQIAADPAESETVRQTASTVLQRLAATGP